MQNIAKFKNLVISGVVAVQCACHGCFMPRGMVDLRRGEGLCPGPCSRLRARSTLGRPDIRRILSFFQDYVAFSDVVPVSQCLCGRPYGCGAKNAHWKSPCPINGTA
ncbi:hypothetical protein C8R44DRAFT_984695 [Mycena epipterygia]|nr:hypothetical protein C8R44DRAFT_984695 [Mycena epipterygia]